MEWGQQMTKHQQNSRNAMYQNSNYSFERKNRKTVVINTTKFSGNASDVWSTTLFEPLIIDKLSDVFLESFITYNCSGSNSSSTCAFVLSINEFNINTNTSSHINGSGNLNNPHCFNNILIPNEQGDATASSTIHKAKKLNYICSINPTRLSTLSGTINNINNGPIWNDSTSDIRLIVELVIIGRD